MEERILDWALGRYLKNVIDELPEKQRFKLRGLRNCGIKLVPMMGQKGAIVMSNGRESKFHGVAMCQNTFACPICSAYRMSKYAADIAAGIDYMKEQGYIGFMVTFTIPHLKFMSCKEVTTALYKTFKYFRQTAKQKYKRRHVEYIPKIFFDMLRIRNYVSVCEYTWGKNGWHPHFHSIFWTHKSNANKILQYEEELRSFWLYHAKRILKEMFVDKSTVIDNLFKKCEKNEGIVISKDKLGKVLIANSSDYIAGWGSDKELTKSTRKKAADEHYTPYQILNLAYEGNDFFKNLYIEFCLAVKSKPVHHRVLWSKNGFHAKIKIYLQRKRLAEFIKKKETEEKWRVVVWFTEDEWQYINWIESGKNIKSKILELATQSKEVLLEFLEKNLIRYEIAENYFERENLERVFNTCE